MLKLSMLCFFLWTTILLEITFIDFCAFFLFFSVFFTGIKKRLHLETSTGGELGGCWWKSCDWNYSPSKLQGRFVRKRFSSHPKDQGSWVATRHLHMLLP